MFQEFADRRRIKQVVREYIKKCEDYPELSYSSLCKIILRNWIYNATPIKDFNYIDKYIEENFDDSMNLFDVCYFGLTLEFRNAYGFSTLRYKNIDDHMTIIDGLAKRIKDELKKYYSEG